MSIANDEGTTLLKELNAMKDRFKSLEQSAKRFQDINMIEDDTIQSREFLQPTRVAEWKQLFPKYYGVPFHNVVCEGINLARPGGSKVS